MSREADLVDLIKTANEIYLVNPAGNARSAYIQIDDLCELIMKSYLQASVNAWSPISHQHHGRDYFKGFWAITSEVRHQLPGNQIVSDLLDRIESRRTNRNSFFHDHQMSGLTITDDHCLQSFCDLYALFHALFPTALSNHATPVLRAQVAAIHALRDCAQNPSKKQQYNAIVNGWRNGESPLTLRAKGEVRIKFPNLAYDYCVIHYYPDRFYDELNQKGLLPTPFYF
jgi:hypothetical protein